MLCKDCLKLLCTKVLRTNTTTENTCENCNDTFVSYSIVKPKLCKSCSDRYGLCECCGKAIK